MKFIVRSLLVCVVSACLSACTYQVRESNVVIARKAPTADIDALRTQFPNYRVEQKLIVAQDGSELYSLRFLRSDAVATVLYFGGNGYTLAKWAPITARAYKEAPVNFVLVDHRGYGASTGTPTLDALMSDALRVYDSLVGDSELGGLPLIVHGHSLGSFMAGHVASSRRVAGLILESSVTTTEDWTAHLRTKQSAWLRALVWRVKPDDTLAGKGNRSIASQLGEPVLFVVGANDDVTPPRFSKELFDAVPLSPGRKHLLIVPDKSHMNAWDSPDFRVALSAFVAQVVEEQGQPPH